MDVSPPAAWDIPDHEVSLEACVVHVWRLRLDRPDAIRQRLAALLSSEEKDRAVRFINPMHGARFTVAHAALRLVLSRYLPTAPRDLAFQTNDHGKPSLQDADGVSFNLSHSGDWALIAVTSQGAIGVDIERYRESLEAEKIARRHFSDTEVARLFALPEVQRENAFYACWTRKEAYIKARGEGLAMGLKRFDVAFTPDEAPALLRSEDGPEELARWTMFSLDPAPRFAAACVVEGPVSEVRCWDGAKLDPDI